MKSATRFHPKFENLEISRIAPNAISDPKIQPKHSSADSSADSSLHFNANGISTEDDAALDQSILPSSAADISASLSPLWESFSKLVANQARDSRKSSDAHSEVLCKIDHVERVFLDSLAAQNDAFRGLFKSIRQEAQNDNNALSLALKSIRTQNAILSTDLAATQNDVKDIKVALSKDFDDKLADIRNDLLEFRVETQEQLASLCAHLAELIAFITKGSDDKKGEGSSNRPQPPPDDQNRPSGGSGSRADDPSRSGGGTVSREVVTEVVMVGEEVTVVVLQREGVLTVVVDLVVSLQSDVTKYSAVGITQVLKHSAIAKLQVSIQLSQISVLQKRAYSSVGCICLLLGVARSSPGARLGDWVVTEAVNIKSSSGTFLKRKKGRHLHSEPLGSLDFMVACEDVP
ncbi:hypothetical protein F511_20331 [Dorcoceras hygrometricum]|uniref:Uncharacterized protein n=1 Tax=Dorcoceras hygrometricum TaxID=472368 RepID=A0A2Z7D994_9LAMI|nr:hypothetical protein F511_20331 [Dorcoceras hygrometricum]